MGMGATIRKMDVTGDDVRNDMWMVKCDYSVGACAPGARPRKLAHGGRKSPSAACSIAKAAARAACLATLSALSFPGMST